MLGVNRSRSSSTLAASENTTPNSAFGCGMQLDGAYLGTNIKGSKARKEEISSGQSTLFSSPGTDPIIAAKIKAQQKIFACTSRRVHAICTSKDPALGEGPITDAKLGLKKTPSRGTSASPTLSGQGYTSSVSTPITQQPTRNSSAAASAESHLLVPLRQECEPSFPTSTQQPTRNNSVAASTGSSPSPLVRRESEQPPVSRNISAAASAESHPSVPAEQEHTDTAISLKEFNENIENNVKNLNAQFIKLKNDYTAINEKILAHRKIETTLTYDQVNALKIDAKKLIYALQTLFNKATTIKQWLNDISNVAKMVGLRVNLLDFTAQSPQKQAIIRKISEQIETIFASLHQNSISYLNTAPHIVSALNDIAIQRNDKPQEGLTSTTNETRSALIINVGSLDSLLDGITTFANNIPTKFYLDINKPFNIHKNVNELYEIFGLSEIKAKTPNSITLKGEMIQEHRNVILFCIKFCDIYRQLFSEQKRDIEYLRDHLKQKLTHEFKQSYTLDDKKISKITDILIACFGTSINNSEYQDVLIPFVNFLKSSEPDSQVSSAGAGAPGSGGRRREMIPSVSQSSMADDAPPLSTLRKTMPPAITSENTEIIDHIQEIIDQCLIPNSEYAAVDGQQTSPRFIPNAHALLILERYIQLTETTSRRVSPSTAGETAPEATPPNNIGILVSTLLRATQNEHINKYLSPDVISTLLDHGKNIENLFSEEQLAITNSALPKSEQLTLDESLEISIWHTIMSPIAKKSGSNLLLNKSISGLKHAILILCDGGLLIKPTVRYQKDGDDADYSARIKLGGNKAVKTFALLITTDPKPLIEKVVTSSRDPHHTEEKKAPNITEEEMSTTSDIKNIKNVYVKFEMHDIAHNRARPLFITKWQGEMLPDIITKLKTIVSSKSTSLLQLITQSLLEKFNIDYFDIKPENIAVTLFDENGKITLDIKKAESVNVEFIDIHVPRNTYIDITQRTAIESLKQEKKKLKNQSSKLEKLKELGKTIAQLQENIHGVATAPKNDNLSERLDKLLSELKNVDTNSETSGLINALRLDFQNVLFAKEEEEKKRLAFEDAFKKAQLWRESGSHNVELEKLETRNKNEHISAQADLSEKIKLFTRTLNKYKLYFDAYLAVSEHNLRIATIQYNAKDAANNYSQLSPQNALIGLYTVLFTLINYNRDLKEVQKQINILYWGNHTTAEATEGTDFMSQQLQKANTGELKLGELIKGFLEQLQKTLRLDEPLPLELSKLTGEYNNLLNSHHEMQDKLDKTVKLTEELTPLTIDHFLKSDIDTIEATFRQELMNLEIEEFKLLSSTLAEDKKIMSLSNQLGNVTGKAAQNAAQRASEEELLQKMAQLDVELNGLPLRSTQSLQNSKLTIAAKMQSEIEKAIAYNETIVTYWLDELDRLNADTDSIPKHLDLIKIIKSEESKGFSPQLRARLVIHDYAFLSRKIKDGNALSLLDKIYDSWPDHYKSDEVTKLIHPALSKPESDAFEVLITATPNNIKIQEIQNKIDSATDFTEEEITAYLKVQEQFCKTISCYSQLLDLSKVINSETAKTFPPALRAKLIIHHYAWRSLPERIKGPDNNNSIKLLEIEIYASLPPEFIEPEVSLLIQEYSSLCSANQLEPNTLTAAQKSGLIFGTYTDYEGKTSSFFESGQIFAEFHKSEKHNNAVKVISRIQDTIQEAKTYKEEEVKRYLETQQEANSIITKITVFLNFTEIIHHQDSTGFSAELRAKLVLHQATYEIIKLTKSEAYIQAANKGIAAINTYLHVEGIKFFDFLPQEYKKPDVKIAFTKLLDDAFKQSIFSTDGLTPIISPRFVAHLLINKCTSTSVIMNLLNYWAGTLGKSYMENGDSRKIFERDYTRKMYENVTFGDGTPAITILGNGEVFDRNYHDEYFTRPCCDLKRYVIFESTTTTPNDQENILKAIEKLIKMLTTQHLIGSAKIIREFNDSGMTLRLYTEKLISSFKISVNDNHVIVKVAETIGTNLIDYTLKFDKNQLIKFNTPPFDIHISSCLRAIQLDRLDIATFHIAYPNKDIPFVVTYETASTPIAITQEEAQVKSHVLEELEKNKNSPPNLENNLKNATVSLLNMLQNKVNRGELLSYHDLYLLNDAVLALINKIKDLKSLREYLEILAKFKEYHELGKAIGEQKNIRINDHENEEVFPSAGILEKSNSPSAIIINHDSTLPDLKQQTLKSAFEENLASHAAPAMPKITFAGKRASEVFDRDFTKSCTNLESYSERYKGYVNLVQKLLITANFLDFLANIDKNYGLTDTKFYDFEVLEPTESDAGTIKVEYATKCKREGEPIIIKRTLTFDLAKLADIVNTGSIQRCVTQLSFDGAAPIQSD